MKLSDVSCDSCGTHGYHIGEAPDQRTIAAARKKGVDMRALRARKLNLSDFDNFDYLIAMDQGHMDIMKGMTLDPLHHEKMHLLMDFTQGEWGRDVIDPYYGDVTGFDDCFNCVKDGVDAMMKEIL